MKLRTALLAGFLLFSISLLAQTFRGTILGTVADPQGAMVAGAKVAVRNTETGLERTTTTSVDGSYAIPELPIGNYTVTVSQSGFQTSVTTNISVTVASEKRVDVMLKAGQVATTVEVSGETLPQVETTADTLGGGFIDKQVVDLPINGRDYTKLLIMVPGAAGEPNGGGDSPGSYGLFSANGSRGRANNFLLDGTDMNDGYRNLPAINQGGVFGTPGTVLPLDVVAELKVLSNFEAEYGRSSGAVVNIVTKSGTNALHGAVYEDFRNAALDARNFFNSAGAKDAFRNNQFGATVGGSIVKDKTFFFFAYEGQREGLAITSLNVVPTLNSSSGDPGNDFAKAVGVIAGGDPSQCTTTIINCIRNQPAGVINPVILNFFNFCDSTGKCSGGKNIWPLTNISLPNTSANSSDPAAASNNVDSMIVKLDQNLGKSQLSGRYFFGNSKQNFPLGLAGGNNLPNTNTFAPIRTQLVSISLVSVIKPNQTNEARFGWNRYRNGFFAADRSVFGNPEQTLHLNTGVTNPNDYGLPTIRFGEISALGSSPFSNPRNRVDTNWQFFDNYTWIAGKHNVKAGYEFRRTAVSSFNDFSGRGVMVFNALSDFLQGMFTNTVLFSSRQQVGNTNRQARQNNDGFYLQDSIRLNNRLTVNAGLRWDYFGVIHEAHGLLTAYDFTSGIVARNPLYGKDLNNFAPRLSFAWDVTGKGRTVVRSGVGVFYDDFSQDAFTGQIYENSFNAGVAYNPVPNAPVQILKPDRSIPLQPDTPVFTCATCSDATSDVSTVPKNMRTPYVYNYNLNLQQQLFSNAVLQVGYVGSSGRKLLRLRDLNEPTQAQINSADTLCNCINDGTLRKYANLPNMSSLEPFAPFYLNELEASGTSSYNSMQVSLTQQNFHGLAEQIAYTWSHSIDTASDSQDFVPNASMPQNSNNVAGDKGPSNYDTRNRFVWSSTYDLPKWGTHDKLGAGWSVSGVFTLISGHPFSMNYNFIDDFSGSAEFYDRPDVVGPVRYNYSNPYQFLNLNSFQVPCVYNNPTYNLQDGFADSCQPGTRHYGNLGRNALLGPNYRNFDFALSKTTALTERWQILFRADFYNLTNHPNFANPLAVAFFADAAPNRTGTNPTGIDLTTGRNLGYMPITATSDVGLGNPVLGGGGQRSIQLSLKLMF